MTPPSLQAINSALGCTPNILEAIMVEVMSVNKQFEWPWYLLLRDTNPDMVMAWLDRFADAGPWSIGSNNILRQKGDAIVSPANSYGYMDGGIDLAYRNHFGLGIQNRLQLYLKQVHGGCLPIGEAVIIQTMNDLIPLMIVAPTMERPTDVSRTENAYLAMRAVFCRVRAYNETARERGESPIHRILVPGLATGIGCMNVDESARQMRRATDEALEEDTR
jgi:O-acetyl-ADP-ribose deacetylase (regulator of RNase III)